MKKHQVQINTNACIGCSMCAKTCVANNIEIINNKANTILEDCLMCGQCSDICPKQAITITGYDEEQLQKQKETYLEAEDVLNTIRFRRSIRQFQNKAVTKDICNQILEAGRLTHTAKNKQDVAFVVLDKEKDEIEKRAVRLFKKIKPFANLISPMARRKEVDDHFFFFNAPLVIVILAHDKTNGILAAQNMEFVAEANGLGVLYSGFFTMAANLSFSIKKALGIQRKQKVAMTLVLGYPKMRFLRSTPHKQLDVKYM